MSLRDHLFLVLRAWVSGLDAKEVDSLWQKLQEAEKSRGDLQTSLSVAGGELTDYQRKVAELEGALAAKERGLQEQAGMITQKEATS